MKQEANKSYTIEIMRPDDVEPATRMRLQSWLDTYVNETVGVTSEWIKEHTLEQLDPERIQLRREALDNMQRGAWVAKSIEGEIIGVTTPFIDTDNTQHVGSLYVDKRYHGLGVAHDLMREVINWSDPRLPLTLGVVTYNDRAKAFYRKWGFEEIPGTEQLFAHKIPEITMIRKGDKQDEV